MSSYKQEINNAYKNYSETQGYIDVIVKNKLISDIDVIIKYKYHIGSNNSDDPSEIEDYLIISAEDVYYPNTSKILIHKGEDITNKPYIKYNNSHIISHIENDLN